MLKCVTLCLLKKAGQWMQVTLTLKVLFKFVIWLYFQVLASIIKSQKIGGGEIFTFE